MSLIINTNVSSLNAQRQLVSSGNDLDQASERLASGRRINNAADDAAGLAISNRQTSQIRGLNQAIRNANDGISLVQTAEGALDETTNILQRIRELSIQSGNGIYSDADRATLDAEVQQLKAEIDRIAETTTFNGQNILDGTLETLSLQVGAEANETIDLDVQGFNASSLGGASGDVVGGETTIGALNALTGATGATVTINGITLNTLAAATTVNDVVDSINADLSGNGVSVSTLVTNEASSVGSGILRGGSDTLTIVTEDGDSNDQTFVITDTGSMSELINKINSETSVTASLNDNGELVLSQEGIESITVTDSTAATTGASGFAAGAQAAEFALSLTDTSADSNGITISGDNAAANVLIRAAGLNVQDANGNTQGVAVSTAAANEGDLIINGVAVGAVAAGAGVADKAANAINAINAISAQTGVVASAGTIANSIALRSVSGEEFSIEAGNNVTDAALQTSFGLVIQNDASGAGSVASIDISTQAGAQRAIDIVDVALEEINSQRADLGAVNNRLDFTISNLANVSENTSAARSRIVDADFAAESAALSRAQVLQQASQAILAQANARPQQVLQLLQ